MMDNEIKKIIKIFLSYNSEDYNLAQEIKRSLESCGLDIFLAHTSIEPTTEWQKEIHKSLKKCDVFIPILTENFKKSYWTDQESGIAFNEGKKILSLKIDIDPYGFLGQFQALNFNLKDIHYDLNKFEKKLEIIEKLMIFFPNEIRESFISSLDKTEGYKIGTAKCRFMRKLEKIKPFNSKEINEIVKGIINNSQLYDAHEVKPYVEELVERYGDKIESNLKQKFLNEIENEKAIAKLGGKTNAGQPIIYGTPKQRLEQLKGYSGENIDKIRELTEKEIEEEIDKEAMNDPTI